MRSEIKHLVDSLLSLHKALLDSERSRYESKNGPIRDNNEYFNLVVSHDDFKWLRFLSGMIAILDEEVEQDEMDKEKIMASLAGLRKAMDNDGQEDFSAKYLAALASGSDIARLGESIKGQIDNLLTK